MGFTLLSRRRVRNLTEDFDLDWRDGALLLFTIERGKVRDVEYMKEFVAAGRMARKTLYRHRNRLLGHGLLEKAYDREVGAIVYHVPERHRYLADERAFRRAMDAGQSFSIDLHKGMVNTASRAVSVPLTRMVTEGYSLKTLLELAAWIKREPSGWPEDDYVKEAKSLLKEHPHLLPEIGPPSEDPDRYAFIWPRRSPEELTLETPRFPRFFDMKLLYDAVAEDVGTQGACVGPVFAGAYWSPVIVGPVDYDTHMRPPRSVGRSSEHYVIETPQSVCVAVCREPDTNLQVVYLETRKGTLNRAWVNGLVKQLTAKKAHITEHASLTDDVKRVVLLNLRQVLEQQRLRIPRRYTSLIQELREYGYRKPSSGYVLALALAVDCCLN